MWIYWCHCPDCIPEYTEHRQHNVILRTKEFAVLKALGMTQRNVKKMILLEGVFYGLYAAVYGSILGTVLSYGIHRLFKGAVDVGWTILGAALFLLVQVP
ncbi:MULTISPECIES: FtsX-like permease family protein [Paenibacillus]|nr:MULTISPECIES: ABC transporter permease [Paenibacillus]AUJ88429.1 ABC transporter permease [Paenibacillus polymyxa]POR28671.1 ABC transporter permease [Paenibacillus polymyxa]